jgi:hypothetical protein
MPSQQRHERDDNERVRTLSCALTSENCDDIVRKTGVLEAPFRNLFAKMRAVVKWR